MDATNHKAFDKILESMTVEDVRNAARKFLKNVKVRDWVIKSEEVNPLSDWENSGECVTCERRSVSILILLCFFILILSQVYAFFGHKNIKML